MHCIRCQPPPHVCIACGTLAARSAATAAAPWHACSPMPLQGPEDDGEDDGDDESPPWLALASARASSTLAASFPAGSTACKLHASSQHVHGQKPERQWQLRMQHLYASYTLHAYIYKSISRVPICPNMFCTRPTNRHGRPAVRPGAGSGQGMVVMPVQPGCNTAYCYIQQHAPVPAAQALLRQASQVRLEEAASYPGARRPPT